ncbi:unnamed protein product, partial [Rotaria sordida]
MSIIILQDTLTVDIDIRDIIQNNPRLKNDVLPLILAKFPSIVPNVNEIPEGDLKKKIQRKVNDRVFSQNDLDTSLVNFNNPTTVRSNVSIGTKTLVQPKRTRQSAYLHINDAVKLLIHGDPSVLDNTDNQKIHIKHNMDSTTIRTSTNFLMSTITCIESGAKRQTPPNVIPL